MDSSQNDAMPSQCAPHFEFGNASSRTVSPAPTQNISRPKLQPKPAASRHKRTPPASPPDPKIIFEDDDGTLPAGYQGTWNNIRFYSPGYAASMNCYDGLHHLSCDHWVKTPQTANSTPCGANCHVPHFGAAPFICPTCRSAVKGVIDNQLTEDEKGKIKQANAAGLDTYAVGLLVELVVRRVDMKGNVTEMVIDILHDGKHGRECEASGPPDGARVATLEEQLREYKAWKADRKFAAANMEAVGAKRLAVGDDSGVAVKKRKRRVAKDDGVLPRAVKRASPSTDLALPKGKRIQVSRPV